MEEVVITFKSSGEGLQLAHATTLVTESTLADRYTPVGSLVEGSYSWAFATIVGIAAARIMAKDRCPRDCFATSMAVVLWASRLLEHYQSDNQLPNSQHLCYLL